MAFPRLRTVEIAPGSTSSTRLISAEDAPVASPVHALQDSLQQLVLPPRHRRAPIDLHATAIRVALYVVTPLALWGGIVRLSFLG